MHSTLTVATIKIGPLNDNLSMPTLKRAAMNLSLPR
jgi:hypothetical protein